MIPTVITQALTRDEIHLGNLDARRDLTYVSDTVAGFIKAAETPNVEGQTLNLGTGSDIRIGDLANEMNARINEAARRAQKLLWESGGVEYYTLWRRGGVLSIKYDTLPAAEYALKAFNNAVFGGYTLQVETNLACRT